LLVLIYVRKGYYFFFINPLVLMKRSLDNSEFGCKINKNVPNKIELELFRTIYSKRNS
jgi:hypothetical protein